jgi:hypothetical protein
MKLTKLLLSLLVVAMTILFSCQKEFSTIEDPVTGPTSTAPNITTSISGRIIDEQFKPVAGASVKAGSSTTFTNVNGEFTLANAYVYDQAAYVQVTKTGYFTGSRTFVAKANTTHFVEIKLLPKTINGTVSASTGGTITLASGTAVTLPASGVIVAATNAGYTGNVNVSMAWIDPAGADLGREMPGDLRGVNASNTEMGLQSYGMVAVELTGDAGQKLQIASGKKATLKFNLSMAIATSAPADVPLWSFDESTGLWKQEGTATKSGNFYTAEVSHFSFWNCDAQFPILDFTAIVKDQNGLALKYKLVRIKRTTTGGIGYGMTDNAGVVTGKVPSNETLVLEIVAGYNCGNSVIHSQNIGPFSAATTINVTVNSVAALATTITGTAVNCAGAPVTNGFADVIVNAQTHRAPVVNGAFSIDIYTCSSNQAATVVVTDLGTSQQGAPVSITLTTGAVATGSITACGTSISQFINFTLNGTAYSMVPPGDSLTARLINQGAVSTNINGYSINSSTNNRSISFNFSGAATGTFPVTGFYVSVPGTNGMMPQSPGASASITEYSAAGGYVAGSFSANVVDSLSGTIPVTVNFRVKRN